jgi:hypothetical protein
VRRRRPDGVTAERIDAELIDMDMIHTTSPLLRRLHRDWQSWRRGREFPARRDFKPEDIAYLLGWINLLEVQQNPIRFKFRLHGSEIVRLLGYDLTGKFVDENPRPQHRERVIELSLKPLAQRGPTSTFENVVLDDRFFRCETLQLPLSDDGRAINMLIAAYDFRADRSRRNPIDNATAL